MTTVKSKPRPRKRKPVTKAPEPDPTNTPVEPAAPSAAPKKRRRGRPKKTDKKPKATTAAVALQDLPMLTPEQHAKNERTRRMKERMARLAWVLEHRVCNYLENIDE